METIIVAFATFSAGFLVAALLFVSSKKGDEAQFEERLRQNTKQVSEDTLKRSNATIKGQLGERFAPFSQGFGYEPADARFLGSPVDYVVFDGLTDGQIRAIAFVEVKTGVVDSVSTAGTVRRSWRSASIGKFYSCLSSRCQCAPYRRWLRTR